MPSQLITNMNQSYSMNNFIVKASQRNFYKKEYETLRIFSLLSPKKVEDVPAIKKVYLQLNYNIAL